MNQPPRRQLQHGHTLLPVGQLQLGQAAWTRLRLAMAADEANTRQIMANGDEKTVQALGLLADQQRTLCLYLETVYEPAELRCDDVRLLVTAARRAHHMVLAERLIELFNTVPARIK